MRFLLACSATKRDRAGPIAEVYDGPMWRQVRAAGAADRVAALSAKYGFLEPGAELEPYDQEMTFTRRDELAGDRGQAEAFAAWCDGDRVIVFGGEHYRAVIRAWCMRSLNYCMGVEIVRGSFLVQRKRLGQLLRGELEAAAAPASIPMGPWA